MGFSGASGMERFMGSTTTRVLKSSEVPVVIVKDIKSNMKYEKNRFTYRFNTRITSKSRLGNSCCTSVQFSNSCDHGNRERRIFSKQGKREFETS